MLRLGRWALVWVVAVYDGWFYIHHYNTLDEWELNPFARWIDPPLLFAIKYGGLLTLTLLASRRIARAVFLLHMGLLLVYTCG